MKQHALMPKTHEHMAQPAEHIPAASGRMGFLPGPSPVNRPAEAPYAASEDLGPLGHRQRRPIPSASAPAASSAIGAGSGTR